MLAVSEVARAVVSDCEALDPLLALPGSMSLFSLPCEAGRRSGFDGLGEDDLELVREGPGEEDLGSGGKA